jgi:toxin-antitoxin system PIN domain toxin
MTTASSERQLLLDVNALVALAWPNHQFHQAVVSRLERRPAPRWATCALTQLGFVRLSSNPAVVGVRRTPYQALDLLADLVGDDRHGYLESLPALPEAATQFRLLLGHQQVTDAYLLAVASKNDAVLLTLDQRLVPADTAHQAVEVITP